jgi:hypothetical protein
MTMTRRLTSTIGFIGLQTTNTIGYYAPHATCPTTAAPFARSRADPARAELYHHELMPAYQINRLITGEAQAFLESTRCTSGFRSGQAMEREHHGPGT